MPILGLAFRGLVRDWRAGELRLIAAASVIAVASLTTVGFFTDRVERAIDLQATELLAADLVVSSSSPIPAKWSDRARQDGLTTALTTEFRSVALAGQKLQLAEVKAVQRNYPIRGRLRISNALFEAARDTSEIPEPGSVWVDSRLMQSLGVRVGDDISLGASRLRVAKVLVYEPDRGGDLFSIAPRLLMNYKDLTATRLLLPGSRAEYRLLLGGSTPSLKRFSDQLAAGHNADLNILSVRDERPQMRTALDRSAQFLALAVIISIALCGLAIAMSAHRYAVRRFDACAIMRCLGADQASILRLHLIQLLVLAALFGLIGCGVGYFTQEFLARLLRGLTARPLPDASFGPVIQGMGTALLAVLGFGLPQIWRLGSVSPLRVLRRDLTPMPVRSIVIYGFAALALILVAPWRTGDMHLTLYVLAGCIATEVALGAGALGAIRLAGRLRSRVGVSWRYGLANLSRRSRDSAVQILGIGLGAMVMLLLTLVRTDLLQTWENRLPPRTPNYFLINIQPDQVTAVRRFLRRHVSVSAGLYPMVRGRLVRISDHRVVPEHYKDERAQHLARREFNLSVAAQLQKDNRITAGRWWATDVKGTQFSVEDGIASRLGIHLGDTLTFNVADQDVTGKVTSLRSVDWDSFNANFFVVANPGALRLFPATYITSFYLASDNHAVLTSLVRAFPSVTVIDVDAILSQVRSIISQVAKTVQFVFIFTVLAGIVVLLAALQSTHDERRRESALLRSLGAGRRRIAAGLAAEFLVLGTLAGVLAAVAATCTEALLAHFVFQMEVHVDPWLWLLGPAACVMVIVPAGLLGTRGALSTPPAEVLRQA